MPLHGPRAAQRRRPRGHLDDIAAALRDGGYDALLPTHEQAWLFAAGRHLLPADAPLAVADIEAFGQVQGTRIAAQTFTTTPQAAVTGLPV